MAADGGAFARLATIELPPGRYAVLVDAGYLLSSAGELVLGTSRRREMTVDVVGLIGSVMQQVVELFGSDLVRIYWYDAARDRVPTVQQRQIASLPHVKLRLGNVNRAGVQKGVDALLRVDLVGLASTGAVRDVVLLAGDEDMLEAVESAQAHGVRVHLWGVEPPFGVNQAERLVWECDSVHVLGKEVVDGFVRARVAPGDKATRDAMAKVAAAIAAEPTADAELVSTAEPVLPAGIPEAPHTPSVEPPVEPTVEQELPPEGEPEPSSGSPDRPTPAQVAAALGRPGRPAPARRTAASVRPPAPTEPVDLREVVPRPDAAELVEVGRRVAGRWLVERGRDNLADLLPGPELPAVIEKELLVAAESEVGFNLRGFADSREAVRRGFWERLFTEFGISLGVSQG
jgi:uncharacterized LabA/DUF88 family protein